MEEPKSLDTLFNKKIFRIPDFQRGFAWQKEQLKDFWEDLINLSGDRSHYTGVLTLKQIENRKIEKFANEYWLVEDYSYHEYHIIDGQQRLTTFLIFLQAFIEFIRCLPDYSNKPDKNIYITDSLNIAGIIDSYFYRVKPTGDKFRTYLFGYDIDNPSYKYLRHKIFCEPGGGSIDETYYTLNLSNAKKYFSAQISDLYANEGLEGITEVYKKSTKRFLFNEYIIKDEFDVFVAFETMNNRGKGLSDLEKLKNRLIYLTTLYIDEELDIAGRRELRELINDTWKEIYHQLGRNKTHPLKDDEFLRAHWIMYYKYSRQTGKDYTNFLLDEEFTPKNINKKVESEVNLDIPEEVGSPTVEEERDEDNGENNDEVEERATTTLQPTEIRDYSISLKDSVVYWFNTFYPEFSSDMSDEEKLWIDRLNRINIGYFRPLIMAILKNEKESKKRIQAFKAIERFVFIDFRLSSASYSHGSSEFYRAARALDRGDMNLKGIIKTLEDRLLWTVSADNILENRYFYNTIYRKFTSGSGYYDWPNLRYFLYEYETSLLSESRQRKVNWNDLLIAERDKISIEHIYPQTENKYWSDKFSGIKPADRKYYCNSLGNLLLLSMSINSSLQNDSFTDKKNVKYDVKKNKVRNGYSDGSHSEIEVSQQSTWGPDQIRDRGIKLLRFMEERWDFNFNDDKEREKLLFLPVKKKR